MSGLEKRMQEYRENLMRMTELKKALVDAEISLVSLKNILNLSVYEWRKLIKGELKAREKDVWELINKTPESVKKRDRRFKKFQKILIDKDMKSGEVADALGMHVNKIYRALKDANAARDYETEKAVEDFLGVKVFD